MASDLTLGVMLGASLKSNFAGTFGTAGKSVSELGKTIKQTHAQLGKIGEYTRLDGALGQTRAKLAETQKQAMALRKEMAAGDGSAKLAKNLEKTEAKAVKLSSTLETQRSKLRESGAALRRAGIDTNDLSGANERLTHTYEKQRVVLGATYARMQKRKVLLGELRSQWAKLGGALLAGRALAGWTGEAAKFDAQMQNIGNTADLTAAQIGALKKSIFEASEKTGRSIGDVQAGIGFLVAAGLDVDRAKQSITAIGRAATAESANIEDLSKASFSLIDTLGIKPEGLETALDILTQAGKEGNVELKDMAQQLPVLGAAFKGLHMQGAGAVATMGAALEVARKGAADPAEAANNMRNFLKALTSNTVLQAAQKNFGLDLQKIIEQAQASGANPFEAAMDAIMKTTKGDAFAIAKIFNDAQVQNFLRPLIQNWSEYERIKEKSLAAHGVVDKDFEAMSKTTDQQLKLMGQAWERLKENVGTGLGSIFVNAFGWITPVLSGIGKLAGEFPRLTAGLIGAAGAALTFKTAMIGGQWLATFIPGLDKLGIGLARMVPGFGLAQKGVLALGGALRAVSIGTLFSPMGLAIAGIGVALVGVALLVHKYWEPIKAYFTGVWQGISDAVGPVFKSLGDSLAPLKPAWDTIAGVAKQFFGWIIKPANSTAGELDKVASVGQIVGEVIGTVFNIATFNFRMLVKGAIWLGTAIGETAGWIQVHMGKAADFISGAWNGAIGFIGGLWDGLKARVGAVFDWIMEKIEWVTKKWDTVKGIAGNLWGEAKDAAWTAQSGAALIGHNVREFGLGATAAQMVGATMRTPAMAAPAAAVPSYRVPRMATRSSVDNSITSSATITINATPGMDKRAIGDEVQRRLDEHARQLAARQNSRLKD